VSHVAQPYKISEFSSRAKSHTMIKLVLRIFRKSLAKIIILIFQKWQHMFLDSPPLKFNSFFKFTCLRAGNIFRWPRFTCKRANRPLKNLVSSFQVYITLVTYARTLVSHVQLRFVVLTFDALIPVENLNLRYMVTF